MLGPRVRGRVWTEVAIDYRALRGGKVLCKEEKKGVVGRSVNDRKVS